MTNNALKTIIDKTGEQVQLIKVSPEQHIQMDKNDFDEWQSDIVDKEQYIEREVKLRKMAFKTTGWALIKTNNPGTLHLLAHCETFTHPCIMRDSAGKVVEGKCIAVTSVFTPRANRKRGYGSTMLELLKEAIKMEEDVIGTALWSDIGKEFYASHGWLSHESKSAFIEISDNKDVSTGSLNTVNLTLGDHFQELVDQDVARIKEKFHSNIKDEPLFAILPTYANYEWQFQGGVLNTGYMKIEAPKRIGAKHGDSFVIWIHDFNEKTLFILRHRIQNDQDADALFADALLEARSFNLPTIEVWDPSPLLKAVTSVHMEFENREEEGISCFKVIYSQNPQDSHPMWLANERFAWS